MFTKKNNIKQINRYFLKHKRKSDFFKKAASESVQDVSSRIGEILQNPNAYQVLLLLRSLINSGTWVGHSYIRLIISMLDIKSHELSHDFSDAENFIIDQIKSNRPISYKKATFADIFKAIYKELEYSHKYPEYTSRLSLPSTNCTLVLVSGVFNEIFSTPAFERGAKHLQEKTGIKFISPRVNGTKSSSYNSDILATQLKKYIDTNPNEKLWIIAFSKGGIDSLHFLNENPEFANKHILGLSTIASPILGSERVNHQLLQLINQIHKLENTKVYKYFDQKIDIMFKEFQNSLSNEYQEEWFKNNYQNLPKKIFYTSLAMESEWYESHIWMILTKLLFKTDSINDGIVDADKALYPDYFKGLNLGIIRGHHLVGTRSSFYNQEALMEAHIIFLKYLNMLP